MARKSRKGYYVAGAFIADGSPADRQFRNELKGGEAPSRTERKVASEELQVLGEELLTLRGDLFAALSLPDKLRDAVLEAKRITNFEGLRRQKQFIGKLMHRLDEGELEAVAAALRVQRSRSAEDARLLHRAEQWRSDLIGDDTRLGTWLTEFPGTDVRHLRALVRQARKDACEAATGGSRRQGRAYREIFILVRAALAGELGDQPD